MKILAMISLLLMTAAVGHAATANEDFGLGVILGDPTGLSAKMKLDQAHAIDGALAYSSGKHHGAQIHADYLWDRARSWETTQGPLYMYYGLGGRLITYNDSDDKSQISLGPRGSLGVSFNFFNPNIEVFGEGAIILEIAPSIAADLDVGIGARIRF
jgi:hypothetical protein